MADDLKLQDLVANSEKFRMAWFEANQLTTDQVFEKLNSVSYKSFGFGAIMLHRMTGSYVTDKLWKCTLRNVASWEEPSLRCEDKSPHQALSMMYAWCVHKGYIVTK